MLRTYDTLKGERLDKAIAASTAGANVLAPGKPDKCIICYSYWFVATTTVSVDLEDANGVVKAGPAPCADNGGLSATFNPRGWFILGPGVGLNVGLGGNVVVGGGFSGAYISKEDAEQAQLK